MSSSLHLSTIDADAVKHCTGKRRRFSFSEPVSSESSDSSSTSSSKFSVTFGNAFVREYERVLGGRPDVPMALNLGWKFVDRCPISVDEFDRIRQLDRIDTSNRSIIAVQTSLQQRFAILHYCHGFSITELEDAEILRLQQYRGVEGDPKKQKTRGVFRNFFGRIRNKKNGSSDDITEIRQDEVTT
ncbi:hypothetical protein IV203_008290 [Nitzschia inconspicua]|uniref:Uncharacterized protein n=1 Tax=Nitzschia inconspicua TaxID=303405 RepID=A0A9K3PLW8_9STRA|nr:hypothetical protein IV203_008290 [Nitzschia inconspicua]